MFKLEITGKTPEELKENAIALVDKLYIVKEKVIVKEVDIKEVEKIITTELPSPANKVIDALSAIVDDALDSTGLPFDERIHASTRTKTTEGKWKKRKGVSDETIKQVENELRNPIIPTNTLIPPPPVATVEMEIPPAIAPLTPIAPPPVPPIPSVPTIDPFTVPADAQKPIHNLESFQVNLSHVILELINTNKINQQWIATKCTKYNVQNIWSVRDNQQSVKSLFDEMVLEQLIIAKDY